MTFLLLSMVLVAATVSVVRPAMAGAAPIQFATLTGTHLTILAAVITALGLGFGWVTSLGLFTAYVFHELGHVLGHRLAGYGAVRFRLMPMARGGQAPDYDSDLAAFFVTLMGPALGIAPMVLAFALSDLFAGGPLQSLFGQFALALGAYNFLSLLPVWPLAGGKLVQILLRPGLPHVSALPAASFYAGLIGLSWALEMPLLFLASLVGALAYVMQPRLPADRPGLSRSRSQLMQALSAYLFTLATFFLGGWWVILVFMGNWELPL